jgi:peptidoglycan LD-endopeptidase CwlK
MSEWKSRFGGIEWKVTPEGVVTRQDGLMRSAGSPLTVARFWVSWARELDAAAAATEVPMAILLMTVATESAAKWQGTHFTYPAVRLEPGYTSDDATPGRISFGPCHVTLQSYRNFMGRNETRTQALDLGNNIMAAAKYIKEKSKSTGWDPILVAATYNAGSIVSSANTANNNFKNRWNIRSWGNHLDRAARWYGDACHVIRQPRRELAP